jgi:hypothetical protein
MYVPFRPWEHGCDPLKHDYGPLYATGFIHGLVATVIASIPPGILADQRSRKEVLCLATCALIASSLTCSAFLTLHRFPEPGLHRKRPEARLSAHLGQILRAATKADVTGIIVCLVANGIGTWPAVRRARCCGTRRERPCPRVPLGGESRC